MARSLEAVSVDQLEKFLVCSICLETLKDPRTLPCFHSYCNSCLEKYVKNHRDKAVTAGLRQMKEFNCPTCRSKFTLNPEEKIADMTTNHFVRNMLDVMAVQNRIKVVPCSHCEGASVGRCVTCEVFLCQECLTIHNKYLGFKEHSVLTMIELSKPENQRKIRGKLFCKEHPKKVLKYYCETCSELICRHCMDFNHLKANHSCLPVEEAADTQKELLASDCSTFAMELKRGKEALKAISDVTQSLEREKEQVKRDIYHRKNAILSVVTQQLNVEVERLTDQVDEIYNTKHAILTKRKEEVDRYVDKLESCVNLSTELLQKGTSEEILSSSKMIKENMVKVQTENPKNLKPDDDDKINYKCGPLKIEIHDQMGRVEDLNMTRKYRIGNERGGNFWPRGEHPPTNLNASASSIKHPPSYCDAVSKGSKNPHGNEPTADASKCPICLEDIKNPTTLHKCGHSFCTDCINDAFKHQQKCPICSEVYGVITGNQPPGSMTTSKSSNYLPGFQCSTIVITYEFNGGTQGENHPHPGRRYVGTTRTTYLPDNKEGKKVLRLLKKAFDQKLTFTIGRSSTTGNDGAITWNDIHHKTNPHGGATNFGYPDPTYLKRVQEELAAKGIKE